MKLEKQIESLKKLHVDYTKEVELLTAKEKRVHAALKDATERMLQTFEAIQALEGKPRLEEILTQATTDLGKSTVKIANANIANQMGGGVEPAPEGLPPAEPGFKWAKNGLGEDVLVPINLPKAVTSDSFYVGNLVSPVESDEFSDPRNLLDI